MPNRAPTTGAAKTASGVYVANCDVRTTSAIPARSLQNPAAELKALENRPMSSPVFNLPKSLFLLTVSSLALATPALPLVTYWFVHAP